MASIADISAMKLNAISNDGTRIKDFIDLYYLLHDFDVEQLLNNYATKYELRNSMHALKSLNYFVDVNTEDWPEVLKDKEITWDVIMEKINDSCHQFTKSQH
jgi:hypothetical protein